MFASSVVDNVVEPWLGKTKDYKIDICWLRTKTVGSGIRIMCLSESTCLSVHCCFDRLAL